MLSPGNIYLNPLCFSFHRIEAIWTLKDLLFTNADRKNDEAKIPTDVEKDEIPATSLQLTGNSEKGNDVDQQQTGNDVEQMPPPKPLRTRKSNTPVSKTKGRKSVLRNVKKKTINTDICKIFPEIPCSETFVIMSKFLET